MAELFENNIEWYAGDKTVTFSFSQKRFVNKIKKYAKEHSDLEFNENIDGSIWGHIPLSWIKISPPRRVREYTEEEKIKAAERLRRAREAKKTKEEN